jgi:hypothetical protein
MMPNKGIGIFRGNGMNSNKKNKIFFSYAEKDSKRLKIPEIAKILEYEKYSVYFFQNGIEFLGKKITEDIEKNIKDSKIFIAFFTESYRDSNNCQMECSLASKRNKTIIPLFEESSLIPTSCKNNRGIDLKKTINPSDIVKSIKNVLREEAPPKVETDILIPKGHKKENGNRDPVIKIINGKMDIVLGGINVLPDLKEAYYETDQNIRNVLNKMREGDESSWIGLFKSGLKHGIYELNFDLSDCKFWDQIESGREVTVNVIFQHRKGWGTLSYRKFTSTKPTEILRMDDNYSSGWKEYNHPIYLILDKTKPEEKLFTLQFQNCHSRGWMDICKLKVCLEAPIR